MKTHPDGYHRSPALDTQQKLQRARAFLDARGFSAMILGRRDNFAWLTGGGNSTVVRSSEGGFALLVITRDSLHLVAQTMDGPRILEEEMQGIPAQPALLRWHDESREQKALALAGGGRIASDIPLQGAEALPGEIARLHYPLTDPDMARCRAIGAASEAIIAGVAAAVRPGMTEREVEAMFLGEYAGAGMSCDVLLVGSDERIARYRHPSPTTKRIGKVVLLHPAVHCGGLHANVTRMVCFGDSVPVDTARRHAAACRIAAAAITLSTPGRSFASILEVQKRLYAELGFPEEWHNHFQGGITGYLLADPTLCRDPAAAVSANQAFDWFITITGVKVEELSLAGPRGHEVPSVSGKWPTTTYTHDGQSVALPDILVK